MPLLDISTAQPSLQSPLVPMRVQSLIHGQVLSNPWKSSQLPTRINFHVGHQESQGGNLQIRAVATLEPKCSVPKEDGHIKLQLGGDSSPSSTQLESLKSGDSDEKLDEGEKLRRMRISKANKGNTPWNKGRKHSAETLQRIRERTRLAMQNPKVKMKLVNLGHAQSEETKEKIGIGVRMGWERRREKLMEYRDRVCSGLAKYHGTPSGAERKPKKKPTAGTQSKQIPSKRKASDTNYSSTSETISGIERLRLQRRNKPLYKDPMASSKLEMLKNIRAQRAAEESKKTEAVERARLLIAEAEKAAKTLEVAAVKSPVARASLIKTKKLIEEAIQSIESIERGQVTSDENGGYVSVDSAETASQVEKKMLSENNGLCHAEQEITLATGRVRGGFYPPRPRPHPKTRRGKFFYPHPRTDRGRGYLIRPAHSNLNKVSIKNAQLSHIV